MGVRLISNHSGLPSTDPNFDDDFSVLTDESTTYKEIKNHQYTAQIVRANSKGQWAIESVREHKTNPAYTFERNRHLELYWPTSLYLTGLCELVMHPAFKVMNVQSLPHGFMEITFECPTNQQEIQRGIVVLDPNNYWLIQEATLWTGPDAESTSELPNLTIVNEYYPSKIANIRMYGSAEVTRLGNDITPQVHSFKFTDVQRLAQPLSEFDCTLSAYGLPEPDFYRHPPPYWLYVSIAAMIMVVTGALLLGYRRHLWRKGSEK